MPMRMVVTIALVLYTSLIAVPAEADKRILLKVQSYVDPNLDVVGTNVRTLAELVNKAAAGRVRIKLYGPGKLVPPKEILTAVAAGQLDAGFTTPGFAAGLLGTKANLFSAVPFGPEAPEYLAWLYYGDGRTLWTEMYREAGLAVHSIPCGILPPETSGWFDKPIDSPADLVGLRIRFFGLGALVLDRLGASTSLLPSSEVFPAVEKGVIDATEFSMPVVDERLGLYKVLRYNYFPGWHQPSTLLEFIVHQDNWNEMDEGQQTLLEMGCKASMLDNYALGAALQGPVMRRNSEERGIENRYWSPELLALFESTWNEVVAEQRAADPAFARIWDDLAAFREEYAAWSHWAFIPRPGTERTR